MADVSCRQINLDRPDPLRTFSDLNGYMDRRVVFPTPYVDGQEVTVAGAEFVLVDSSMVAGSIAKGQTTTEHDGIYASPLIGAVGSSSLLYETDDVGNVLNLIEIRIPDTNEAVMVGDAQVFGLLQCDGSVTDGDAIGAAASENLQITFVTIDAYDSISLVSITETVEFTVNKVLLEGRRPEIQMIGNAAEDLLVIGADGAKSFVISSLLYTVTGNFAPNEVITLSTGAGAVSGTASLIGSVITIGASAVEFNGDSKLEVWRNGAKQRKGVDVIWDSADSFHFIDPLSVDENFEVTRFEEETSAAVLDASYFPEAADLQATVGTPWSLSIPAALFDYGGEAFWCSDYFSPTPAWLSSTAAGPSAQHSSTFPLVLSGTPTAAITFTVRLMTMDEDFKLGPSITFTVEVT